MTDIDYVRSQSREYAQLEWELSVIYRDAPDPNTWSGRIAERVDEIEKDLSLIEWSYGAR